jgi:hypothetical protein
MAEDGVSDNALGAALTGDRPVSALTRREWALLIVWPWALAIAAPLAHSGEMAATHKAFAHLLCGSVVLFALVGASWVSPDLENLPPRNRGRRAGSLALALGGASLPALAAMSLSTDASTTSALLAGALICVCAYALLMASAASKSAYPGIVAAWLGVPPLLFYLMLELLGVRADAVLLLGPASGAVVAAGALSPSYGFLGAALVPALVGGALSVFGASDTSGRRSG